MYKDLPVNTHKCRASLFVIVFSFLKRTDDFPICNNISGDVSSAGDANVGPLAFVEWKGRRERQVGHGRVLAVAMSPQVDLALEGLVTESAGKRLVAGVLAHVGDQIGRLAEGFAAHDALVRLLTCNNRRPSRERKKETKNGTVLFLCSKRSLFN